MKEGDKKERDAEWVREMDLTFGYIIHRSNVQDHPSEAEVMMEGEVLPRATKPAARQSVCQCPPPPPPHPAPRPFVATCIPESMLS